MTTSEIKTAVRQRDGLRCTRCALTDAASRERWGKGLEVHRVVPGSVYSVGGCITLCKECHAKKPRSPRKAHRPLLGAQPDRIELQASPEWVKELDAMASAMGMSRSAYIRMCVNLKMAADRKALSGGGPPS